MSGLVSIGDLLPNRTNPSNSDDKLIQIKMQDLGPKPKQDKKTKLLFEVDMNHLSPRFNTFNRIFIHLNTKALLIYKDRNAFVEQPMNPRMAIPVD